jgi:hypothetical protein
MAVMKAKELMRDGYIDEAYAVLEDIQQNTDLIVKTQEEFYNELRNQVIEEVAREMAKFKAFGNDTVNSMAIYIRGMKR